MLAFFRKDYTGLTDEELMVRVAEGNERAFTELYERYARSMLWFFYQRLYQDEPKAQDFLQDLFLKLLEKPKLFNPDKKFKTWLYTIAANMCKNEYRRDVIRGEKVEEDALNNIEFIEPETVLPDALDKSLFASSLQYQLNQLDEHHRTVFLLRYQEECSIAQISEIMGCAEGTVKSRLYYSVRKLALKLDIFNPKNELK